MANKRRKYTPAEELDLTTQVSGHCPICDANLFYEKNGKSYKSYELAHIYPLNPKPEEISLLANEDVLHSDVNHPDNIIPLCTPCHTKFDKPRTVDEYRNLYSLKKGLLIMVNPRKIQSQYHLEEDIKRVIEGLYTGDLPSEPQGLEYNLKDIAAKLDSSISVPTRQKIRHNVVDYFGHIRKEMLELERESPTTSDLIATQVKAFYLKQRTLGLSQQEIFSNIVSWLQNKTNPKTLDAAEIVASYFIQNCEVFE